MILRNLFVSIQTYFFKSEYNLNIRFNEIQNIYKELNSILVNNILNGILNKS